MSEPEEVERVSEIIHCPRDGNVMEELFEGSFYCLTCGCNYDYADDAEEDSER